MARAWAIRWVGRLIAVVVLALTLGSQSSLAAVQPAYEIVPVEPDAGRGVERYQITIGPGGSFWLLASNHLPLIALDQGDAKALEVIEGAWRARYPNRPAGDLQPGDRFVLEVPAGTFVARGASRQGDRVVFDSFGGDQVTTFPSDSVVQYRLRRAADPDRAEVLIAGGQANAVDEAKRIYDVDPPDFVQVRTVRAALGERSTKLVIDLNKKYLDEFRNFRDRAARVEDLSDRLKAYSFDRSDLDIPFVRVDDAVGDETDPGNFPRLFRTAYYRDGTIRQYHVTEQGDALSTLSRPDNPAWARVMPSWQEWQPGQPEALAPFTPAISGSGALLPSRILVIAYRPRVAQATPQPTRPATGSSGAECLGLPIGVLLAAGALLGRGRLGTP